ncbi:MULTISPECIES: hypothetical protein [unclassified Methanoregula]|uniref:hypothetical protein n=1 Tax=unclassified Methanoregula TaxID=2649730 RepID=UPI0009C9484B|nr:MULTISPECIES: hypothetical protein [unclassified Methanoregula]OPX65384.1 MAG: hypothetical protein A4E33_00417 [Methanoregula sp. PtaB.Bin085]OPY32293.1 MAG: hypothetical protein A4E34_02667 [Methanoregula sp. PtaU1.Bin006]
MTDNNPSPEKTIFPFAEALVPVLAFGGTLAGVALHNAGILFEIQYAAIGGLFASCLLAYLAWTRLHKDIVALSTPIYGIIFFVTPIEYTAGVVLQLVYAAGLTILAARLRYRFGPGIAGGSSTKELPPGPLRDYVESSGGAFEGLFSVIGHDAALAFFRFSEGEYQAAAELAHAASCRSGTPEHVVRAFSVIRQHAELLDKNLPRPLTYLTFLPADAPVMAKPLPGPGDPDHEFGTMMDNALLLLFSAAWHASPEDRPSLLSLQQFARKLLEA